MMFRGHGTKITPEGPLRSHVQVSGASPPTQPRPLVTSPRSPHLLPLAFGAFGAFGWFEHECWNHTLPGNKVCQFSKLYIVGQELKLKAAIGDVEKPPFRGISPAYVPVDLINIFNMTIILFMS